MAHGTPLELLRPVAISSTLNLLVISCFLTDTSPSFSSAQRFTIAVGRSGAFPNSLAELREFPDGQDLLLRRQRPSFHVVHAFS